MTEEAAVILMRATRHEAEERDAASRFFKVVRLRTEVPPGSLVIGRYANLPYHGELEADIQNLGSRLVNSTMEHQYIANMDWYWDLSDVTFPTWFRLSDVPFSERGSALVLKGRTNSRKFEWNQKMFARNFEAASRIAVELNNDGLIGPQGVIARKYVPLETFEHTLTGTPITNEWRIFYLNGQRLAWGYYWGNIEDLAPVERARPAFEKEGLAFADTVAGRIASQVPFFVVDIARTQEGQWLVVELNDGCQAGLNGTIDPASFYAALSQHLGAPLA